MHDLWITALQKGIGAALQQNYTIDSVSTLDTDTNKISNGEVVMKKKSKLWEQLLRIPGNSKCCDCNSSNPHWASINLGVTLCIECSGVHRSLGVHYSKVRSLTLDDWEPESVKVMAELGNAVVNRVYEANVPDDFVRPTPACSG